MPGQALKKDWQLPSPPVGGVLGRHARDPDTLWPPCYEEVESKHRVAMWKGRKRGGGGVVCYTLENQTEPHDISFSFPIFLEVT